MRFKEEGRLGIEISMPQRERKFFEKNFSFNQKI